MKIHYTVAFLNGTGEEYMRETHGEDCFSDDLGHAILFENEKEARQHLGPHDYIVQIEEDDEGALSRIGMA